MAVPHRASHSHVPFNEQLYHHIVLPRDVPGQEDRNLPSIEAALLTRLTNATRLLSSHVAPSDQLHVHTLVDSLNACQSLHVDRVITKPALLRGLRALCPGKVLILHVATQNCGLLVYKDAR